jgi:P-aminobenzoate N-oxygenase AurF
MIATAVATPRTTLRAEQLIAASERQTHDPFQAVDWTLPIDDSAYHLPPELLALYGTPVWAEMSEPQRIAYSRHEAAAVFAAGIWFENALMQVVLRHLVDIDVTDPIHRYLLIEVADECRHSAMFGEYIRRAGTPAYAPNRPVIVDETGSGRFGA